MSQIKGTWGNSVIKIEKVIVEKEVIREVPVEKIVEKEVIREVPIEVIREAIVEKIVEIPVDRLIVEERIVEVPQKIDLSPLEERLASLEQALAQQKEINDKLIVAVELAEQPVHTTEFITKEVIKTDRAVTAMCTAAFLLALLHILVEGFFL